MRQLKATLETLMRDKAVACGEIWRAADPLEFPISMEERLRGGDRKIEACLARRGTARAGRRDDCSSAGKRLSKNYDWRLSVACEVTPA